MRTARSLGRALDRIERLLVEGEDESAFDALAACDPEKSEDPRELLRLGLLCFRFDADAMAEVALRRAAKRSPKDPQLHLLLGVAQRRLGRFDEARARFERALLLEPGFADARANLAMTLQDLGAFEDALREAQAGLAAAPDDPDLLNMASLSLVALGREDEAIPWAKRLVEVEDGAPWTRLNLAYALLAAGKTFEGLEAYEARLELRASRAPHGVDAPELDPHEDVTGLRVLVWAEQGAGDTIQFARYLPALVARGARVIVRVPRTLVRLLASIEGLERVVAHDDDPPACDRHLPMGSLARREDPHLERAPSLLPAFAVDPAWCPAALPPRSPADPPRVGLVWAGNPAHLDDRQRSMPVEALAPLLAVPDVIFASLQVGGQGGAPPGGRVLDLEDQLVDFAATAGAIAALDAVVSVDSAVAHLALSIGVPAFVMLPYASEWRWPRDRPSPWYPEALAVRQTCPGEWGGVVEEVARRLPAVLGLRT